MDFRERNRWESTKKYINLIKNYAFLIEKYFEDVRQDEKHVPDLLESIMRPTDPVKEELQPMLFKMTQIKSKISKTRFQLFGFRKSKVFPPEANASLLDSRF